MYFPLQLAPNKILARLPLTPTTLDSIKGITDSGIITVGFDATAVSPSKKQRQFYFDMMTDKDGHLQAKVPVAIELVMLPEGDELVSKLKLEVGQYWGIDNLSVIDFGIDLNEDSNSGFWYFVIEPKRLMYKFSQEQFNEIRENYAKEDIFLQDTNEMLSEAVNEASKKLAGKGGQMPTATMKSPLLDIGNKIHTI
jgi:hypothetical protein